MKLFAYALREYDELPFLRQLAAEKGFEFNWTTEPPSLENAHLAEGCSGVSIITNPINAELLDAFYAVGVRGLATRSIGYEHIDVAHAYDIGMRVGNASYPPEGVAEYTVMLILMALRKVKLVARSAAAQDFTLAGKLGRDLSAQTVGIVGTGNIGAQVARLLSGFGCKLLSCDPYPRDDLRDLVTYTSLDELLAQADVITIHAPATPENQHLIDAAAFAKMKDGVVLVNAARGNLVDSQALMDAVESGKVAQAALDTIENEFGLYYYDRTRAVLPNRDRAALMAYPNVIVTPHMAFYTEEDVYHMVRSTCESLMAFEAGEESPHEVRR